MRLATIDLTPELFLGISRGLKSGGTAQFVVRANPLPDDAEIIKVGLSKSRPDTLRLFLRSDSFAEVREGVEPPELPEPVFETVFSQSGRERLHGIEGCAECSLCDAHGEYF